MQKGAVLLCLLSLMAPPAVAGEIQYIFALPEKATQIDVIGAVSKGSFLRAPAAGDQESVRKYAQVLAKGQTFGVYSASNPVGKAVVESFDADSFCAKVKLDFKPAGNCIVSNTKLKKHAPAAEPTASQRAQALDFA